MVIVDRAELIRRLRSLSTATVSIGRSRADSPCDPCVVVVPVVEDEPREKGFIVYGETDRQASGTMTKYEII